MRARSISTLLAGLGALGACATPAGPGAASAPPALSIAPPAGSLVAATPAAGRAAAQGARASRCVLPPPAAVPPESPASVAGRCRPPSAEAKAPVRARLLRAFEREHDGSRVDVWFGCDRLGPEVDEIVFERGSGHGGSLELWRLRRAREGRPRYELLGLGAQAYHVRPGEPAAQAFRGEVDAGRVEAALPSVRAALVALPREIEAPPPPGYLIRGMRYVTSSNDVHVSVELRDAAGARLERSFTGYGGSSGQEEHLPMSIAGEALSAIVDGAGAEAASVDEEARAFFAGRLRRAAASEPYWWVGERLALLAASFGSAAALGPLLSMARAPAGDASVERSRGLALDALAALSGWDARRGEGGVRRPDGQAAEAYAEACGPPGGAAGGAAGATKLFVF
ncbi:MAG TPA: hypothetical protein VFS43_31050 [Polyangiaceae bacterium]|nr:hypothetical protein [Polyangiaceae bacterium]